MAKIFTKGAYKKQKSEKRRTAKKLRYKKTRKPAPQFKDLHTDKDIYKA